MKCKCISSDWEGAGRVSPVHHHLPDLRTDLGDLRPSCCHQEPEEHPEGREERRGGGHCRQEQCEMKVWSVQQPPVISHCYVFQLGPKLDCNLQASNKQKISFCSKEKLLTIKIVPGRRCVAIVFVILCVSNLAKAVRRKRYKRPDTFSVEKVSVISGLETSNVLQLRGPRVVTSGGHENKDYDLTVIGFILQIFFHVKS